MNLHIGCSGWSYADWVGGFYPHGTQQGDFLKLYAKVFDAVEIDSSYYRIPSPLQITEWHNATPENFHFTAKFPKQITHEHKLVNVSERLSRFYEVMEGLRGKLGPLVIQLPPSFKLPNDDEAFKGFLEQLRPDFRHSVEFRHRSWFKPEIMKLLESSGVGLCWSETQYLSTPPEATSDFAYVRMVGDRALTKFDKKQRDKSEVMKKWHTALEEKSRLFKEGFVFFNNHFTGFSPGSIREYRRLAGLAEVDWSGLSGVEAKQKTLLDF